MTHYILVNIHTLSKLSMSIIGLMWLGLYLYTAIKPPQLTNHINLVNTRLKYLQRIVVISAMFYLLTPTV